MNDKQKELDAVNESLADATNKLQQKTDLCAAKIKKLNAQSGDIVLVSLSESLDLNRFDGMANALREALPKGVKIVVAQEGITISDLSDDLLDKLGLCRKD